jgi:hypothetical protein
MPTKVPLAKTPATIKQQLSPHRTSRPLKTFVGKTHPATLTDVVEELRGLRRDMVVLCRVIVEGQKAQKRSVTATLKKAEEPGSLSANVDVPSWFDAVFQADQEAGG